MNCATDLMKITLSVSELTSCGKSADGSYLKQRGTAALERISSNINSTANSPGCSHLVFAILLKPLQLTYRFTSQMRTSATRGKFGDLKFSMEMRRGYPRARIISVKSATNHELSTQGKVHRTEAASPKSLLLPHPLTLRFS